MKTKVSLSAAALFALCLFSLCPARSEAGYNFGTFQPNCHKSADGSGYCYVSYAGARLSTDPNAWVQADGGATANGQVWGTFYANLNGVLYNCSTSNPALASRFVNISSHPNVFFVVWDYTGACSQVDSFGFSYYSN